MILANLYREVLHVYMLPPKYKPNGPSGSGEEVVKIVFIYMGMATISNFESGLFLAKFCITIISMLSKKFHYNWLSSLIGNVIKSFT